nr:MULTISPECIES: diacylglycerol kinase [unclassified Vibrio]
MVNATKYSYQGIKAAFKNEAAFREEVLLSVIMIPTALLLDVTGVERVLLIGTVLLVMVVELLNSAVEAVVDRIGSEHHELAGRAKDMGSAAVLITMLITGYTWLQIIFF